MKSIETREDLVLAIRETWPLSSGHVNEVTSWSGPGKQTTVLRAYLDRGEAGRPAVASGKTPGALWSGLRKAARCMHGVESMYVVDGTVVCRVCQSSAPAAPAATGDGQQSLPLEGAAA
jgi:hypothetical protein